MVGGAAGGSRIVDLLKGLIDRMTHDTVTPSSTRHGPIGRKSASHHANNLNSVLNDMLNNNRSNNCGPRRCGHRISGKFNLSSVVNDLANNGRHNNVDSNTNNLNSVLNDMLNNGDGEDNFNNNGNVLITTLVPVMLD